MDISKLGEWAIKWPMKLEFNKCKAADSSIGALCHPSQGSSVPACYRVAGYRIGLWKNYARCGEMKSFPSSPTILFPGIVQWNWLVGERDGQNEVPLNAVHSQSVEFMGTRWGSCSIAWMTLKKDWTSLINGYQSWQLCATCQVQLPHPWISGMGQQYPFLPCLQAS